MLRNREIKIKKNTDRDADGDDNRNRRKVKREKYIGPHGISWLGLCLLHTVHVFMNILFMHYIFLCMCHYMSTCLCMCTLCAMFPLIDPFIRGSVVVVIGL